MSNENMIGWEPVEARFFRRGVPGGWIYAWIPMGVSGFAVFVPDPAGYAASDPTALAAKLREERKLPPPPPHQQLPRPAHRKYTRQDANAVNAIREGRGRAPIPENEIEDEIPAPSDEEWRTVTGDGEDVGPGYDPEARVLDPKRDAPEED